MNDRVCEDVRFKWFRCELPWTDRHDWLLPVKEEMHKASIPDAMTFIEAAMKHQPPERRGVCIQAGGLFGLWPMAYARFFDSVFTFEPHPLNWECLKMNLDDLPNITPTNCGLGSLPGHGEMKYSKPQLNSYGAHWLKLTQNGTVEVVTLDGFVQKRHILRVDHIQLDIEGSELEALRGAEDTILRDRPVIVLEHHTLPHMSERGISPNDAALWLVEIGYKISGIVGHDRIFTYVEE